MNRHGTAAVLRPQWQRGQSGNPSGHPGQVLRFARYVAEQTEDGKELCDLLLGAMRDPDAFAARQDPDPEERLRRLSPKDRSDVRRWAVGALLDRFLGRAVQTIKIDREGPVRQFDPTKLTDAQLAALRDALAAGVTGE